uniref:DUF6864 domain-containing function n=1 Tax=Acetatifactor sp. TaxID=1872090 RepID=UPI004055E6C3
MQINLSSGNYNIISSGQVFLFGEEEHFRIDVIADDGFQFALVLKFLIDSSEEMNVTQKIENNTIVYTCFNFQDYGSGSVYPLQIATIGGKQLFFMFWSYLEGKPEKGQVRSIKYTIYSEK